MELPLLSTSPLVNSKLACLIKTSFWNVDCLYQCEGGARVCKLDDSDVIAGLEDHDIVIFAETHCSYSDHPTLPNFAKPVQKYFNKAKDVCNNPLFSFCKHGKPYTKDMAKLLIKLV